MKLTSLALLPLFVLVSVALSVSSCKKEECKQCRECPWDPTIPGLDPDNCGGSSEQCGDELELLEASDIHICE